MSARTGACNTGVHPLAWPGGGERGTERQRWAIPQFAAGGAGGGGEDELPNTIDDGRRGYLLRWGHERFTHRLYLRVP